MLGRRSDWPSVVAGEWSLAGPNVAQTLLSVPGPEPPPLRACSLSSIPLVSSALRGPRWDTHRTPVGHPPYLSGTPTVPHWDTHRTPVGHTPCPSGVHTVPHWDTHRVPVGHTPYPSGTHTVSQWDTHRVPVGYPPCPTWHPRILMLDKGKAIATIPNHRIQVRKNEDSGGCRRYGRAGKAHQTCTGAGVEFFSSCRGLPRCVHASGKHQPEVSARRRDFQPVAARTCRRVVNVTSGLTARVRRKCHGYPCR